MKAYLTMLLAAGALVLAMGVSDPAQARHGGWHGGGGHWHGGWGPRRAYRGWGWGPRAGVYVGPRYAERRCWSKRYGWVPCRWYN
jgi:hypothetical protein